MDSLWILACYCVYLYDSNFMAKKASNLNRSSFLMRKYNMYNKMFRRGNNVCYSIKMVWYSLTYTIKQSTALLLHTAVYQNNNISTDIDDYDDDEENSCSDLRHAGRRKL